MIKKDIASVTIAVFVISILLTMVTEGFTSAFNLDSLGRTIAITAIVGFSQLMVLSIGQFNLALGSMAGVTGMFTAALMEKYAIPVLLALIIGALIGMILGYIQGLLIVKTGINPFIITLSLASIYLGIATVATKSEMYSNLPAGFRAIGKASVFHVPILFLITLGVAVILSVFMYRLPIGRQILATGASERAAYFSGIKTSGIILTAHSISGLLAGMAGILQVARLGSAQLSVGQDWMLVSFAAPVLGATILSGGKVSVSGAILGAMLMSIMINGLVLLNINSNWFQAFLGVMLLAAFQVDRLRLSFVMQKKI
ncbi:MAG: hypothetical protein VR66_02050 [Peptococcaceae bacterium BRH_c23]|nr:MAG: hypothetical protein VR66_02050 [Peptococcaceae bacterium BRH_c23]